MSFLADGQLAVSATPLVDASGANPGSGTISYDTRVNITLANTSGSLSETVILTYTRGASGVARRIYHGTLAANEYAIINNLPFVVGDKISGSTSDATTVDFTVSISSGGGPLTTTNYNVDGSIKQKAA